MYKYKHLILWRFPHRYQGLGTSEGLTSLLDLLRKGTSCPLSFPWAVGHPSHCPPGMSNPDPISLISLYGHYWQKSLLRRKFIAPHIDRLQPGFCNTTMWWENALNVHWQTPCSQMQKPFCKDNEDEFHLHWSVWLLSWALAYPSILGWVP